MGRDVMGLAFMVVRCDDDLLCAGFERAALACGKGVGRVARHAAPKMLEQAAWRNRCGFGLDVRDAGSLLAGLKITLARSKPRPQA